MKRAKKAARGRPVSRRSAEAGEQKRVGRYKAASKLYVGDRLIRAGEIFESDQPPGKRWIPVNAAGKEIVGGRLVEDRFGQPVDVDQVSEEVEKDEAARVAPHRAKAEAAAAGQSGHKRASPGKSVAQQQTDGEEPTNGLVHDNED